MILPLRRDPGLPNDYDEEFVHMGMRIDENLPLLLVVGLKILWTISVRTQKLSAAALFRLNNHTSRSNLP